jgi:hypothetical protein
LPAEINQFEKTEISIVGFLLPSEERIEKRVGFAMVLTNLKIERTKAFNLGAVVSGIFEKKRPEILARFHRAAGGDLLDCEWPNIALLAKQRGGGDEGSAKEPD